MNNLLPVGTCYSCTQQVCPMPRQHKLNPQKGCDMWSDGVEVEQDPLMKFEIKAGFYQEGGVTKLGFE